ncbi:MAG: hypothetical protein RQ723_06830 [Desulfuromonadales bacterium]|nr:hypothetical protein [Desulfuromonadales bacterium]
MNRESLLDSAAHLQQPSVEAAAEFAAQSMRLAEEVNRVMAGRPDVLRLVGEDNLAMMYDNHRNHARFMASLFQGYEPQVLVETVLWVFRAYLAHGFSLAYWPAQLDTWVELFRTELSEETFADISPFYHWLIIHQPQFVALAEGQKPEEPEPAH